MKTRHIIKTLLSALVVGALCISEPSHAIAVIDTLDFGLTGSAFIDCELYGNTHLVRDPSWTDEEFYTHLVEQYAVENSEGDYTTREDYRSEILASIRRTWSSIFYSMIYEPYAMSYHLDFSERPEYYETFDEELMDDYYRAFILDAIGAEGTSFPEIRVYDVLANYCGSDDPIRTTFRWPSGWPYGYLGYIRLGDREVNLSEGVLFPTGNGYMFHEDGFGELKLELSRIDETSIKATYKLKNLSGESTNFGLAYHADIYFGNNDDAAISKTDRSFTITQDNPGYDSTFGAQFHIDLAPQPTTTFIGYYYNAEKSRWESSEKTYYTAADGIDTGLAYSWQGTIAPDEEKTFSATYNIRVVDTFTNYFYRLEDNYTVAEEIGAVDGGAIRMPSTEIASRLGYHREWNTKKDGTGSAFESDTTYIASESRNTYYEVEVPNVVDSSIQKNEGIFEESNIVITDEIRDRYKDIAKNSYSNFRLYSYIYPYSDEDVEDEEENGYFDREDFAKPLGTDYRFNSLFNIAGLYKAYTDSEGDEQEDYFSEDDFPVTIRIKLSKKEMEGKANIKATRALWDEDLEKYVDFEVVSSTYNPETGEILITIDKDGPYVYALSYTEIPEVPNAGMSTNFTSLKDNIILSLAVSFLLISLCYRRFATRSLER